MRIVNRASFIAWWQGTLIKFRHGVGVVGDNVANEEAYRDLLAGKTIGLTVGGKIRTTMHKEGGEFVETEVAR
jgi:hypothetical protein